MIQNYPSESKGIKKWAEEDRPREKLTNFGAHFLSNSELLAIILGSGTRDDSALELARKILNEFGNSLHQLANCDLNSLIKFKGIGEARAVTILACLEIAKRKQSELLLSSNEPLRLSSSTAAYQHISDKLSNLPHEEFWIVLVNRKSIPIKTLFISKGGVASTIVDVKIIIKKAIEHLASGIILAHNHPSGNLEPSEADIKLTKNIKTLADTMELLVLDHIIVGHNDYYSFRDEGLI